ncbi:MAG TPA: response regulator transcription factor [Gemmatimonadaceae bacterium]|jgi:Response regulator containing a CheY-like receiver domain and an HTH DNA-binding domain
MSEGKIRVVLVDDHAVVRSGLRAVLGGADDIEVVGEATNGDEAIAAAKRLEPDVLIMDVTMAGLDGVEATRAIAEQVSASRVLVLTMHTEEEYLLEVLRAGGAGYILKSVADRELVDAVRTVARGEMYVQPSAARVLARGLTRKDPNADERARFEKLTAREQSVLKLVAQGYTAPEIGERLFLSPKTVDTYKQRINQKLGIEHRADYVRLALKLGLLSS